MVHFHRIHILILLYAAAAMNVMVGALIAPSAPAIRTAFSDVPEIDLLARLIFTAPALSAAVGAPILGILSDRFGRKPIFISSILLFSLSGSAAVFAPDIDRILISRLVLGFAAGGLLAVSTAITADLFSDIDRAKIMGYQSAAMGVGGVFSILLGGILSDFSWQGPFFLYLLGLPFVFLAARWLPESAELRRKKPPTLWSDWISWLPFLGIGFFSMVLFFVIPVDLPFYLREDFQVSGASIGFTLSIVTAFSSLSAFSYGWLRKRFSNVSLLLAVLVFQFLGSLSISRSETIGEISTSLIFYGLSIGLVLPVFMNGLAARTTFGNRGRAMGALTGCFRFGQFSCPFFFAPWTAAHGYTGWTGTFGLAGFLALGLIPVAWWTLRKAP